MVGLYNNESNVIRVEIVPNRDGATLKILLEKPVLISNYIVTDAWNGYSFLDSPGYIHKLMLLEEMICRDGYY